MSSWFSKTRTRQEAVGSLSFPQDLLPIWQSWLPCHPPRCHVSTSPCTGLGLLTSQPLRVPAHLTPLSHLLHPRRPPPAPPAALSKPPLICPFFCLQLIKCPFYPQPSPLSWSQLTLRPAASRPRRLWVLGPLDVAPDPWAWPPVYPSGTHTQPGSREGRGGAATAVLLHCRPVALSDTLAVSSFPPPLLHCPLPGGGHILFYPSLAREFLLHFLLFPPTALASSSGVSDWDTLFAVLLAAGLPTCHPRRLQTTAPIYHAASF